ncbi:MAG: DUF3467 domain-containing protein [Mariprofundaceae bacterium]|nr:DUF3467 domain-containing protein [Mariprofundaceae bacterium]
MNHDDDVEQERMELKVSMTPEVQRGVYANQTVITHTKEEFLVDFILATPPVGMVNARVVLSPMHTKRLLRTLQENMSRFEAVFGEIEEDVSAIADGANNFTTH